MTEPRPVIVKPLEIQQLIAKVVDGNSLTRAESERAMQMMLTGGVTPAQIAALLVALRIKGETVEEIAGAATVMRQKALPFIAPDNAFDTCGTGGDQSGSVNISTAVAIVLAACGVPVVKHGNRSVSSRSGSADVLEALGVNLSASAAKMAEILKRCNLAFLMAPQYHPSLRHVSPIRQELKLRTIFNLLGPLANPAQLRYQLLGVYAPELLQPMAEVLSALGALSAWIVCGAEGLDEISISGATQVVALHHGQYRAFTLHPSDAGLPTHPADALRGGDATENAKAMERLLAGAEGAYRDAVLLNTAASLVIAGKVSELKEGAAQAAAAIDSGRAREVLDCLALHTHEAV